MGYAVVPLMWAKPGNRFSNRKTMAYGIGVPLVLLACWLAKAPSGAMIGFLTIMAAGGLALEFFQRRETRQLFAESRRKADKPRGVTQLQWEEMKVENLDALYALVLAPEEVPDHERI